MISKILRLFFNTLTADDKYSLLKKDNLTESIQILVSQKQKTFSRFLSAFLKFPLNFEHVKKKMSFLENVFPKFRTPQKVSK